MKSTAFQFGDDVMRDLIAERLRSIKPSGTLAMAEKARELASSGRRILHLEVGEPDFGTPEHIKEAAYKAIKEDFTHYTSSRGIASLREAISDDLRRIGVNADPDKEIIVIPGSKFGIYCSCLATLNPGDEVLVLTPTWPTHFTCVEFAQARVVEVPCGDTYSLDEENLKERINEKSRMILICSPNNPCGGVLGRDEMRIIADLAEDHNLLILSDEIYNKIVYDGVDAPSIGTFENVKDQAIIVNGFSKAYAMTGWRLGYIVANEKVIEAINRIIQSSTTCPTSFVQKAGEAALRGPQECIRRMVEEYDRRRRFMVERLNGIEGVECVMPKGAFYVFPDLSTFKMSSMEISMRLLEEKGVCSTPGSVFGGCGEGHIRLSYATSLSTISEALDKIEEFLSNIS